MQRILICLALAFVHIDAASLSFRLATVPETDTEAPRVPGASMLAIKQVSHIKPPEGTKTVVHKKEKNGGYVKGSPLYNKQEGIPDDDDKKSPSKAHSALDKAFGDHTDALDKSLDKSAGDHKAALDNAHAHGQATLDDAGAPSSVSGALGYVWGTHFFASLGSVSVYAIGVLICAYFYWKREAGLEALGAKAAGRTPSKLPLWTHCGFAYSFCDCGNLRDDWPICLTAWCCPIISWADTASRSVKPFMSYWKAIALFLAMVVLSPFTLGLSGFVMAIFLFLRRGNLRKAYGHVEDGQTQGSDDPARSAGPMIRQANPRSSVLEDLCVVFCCSQFLCCQLVQEAREIEYNSPPALVYPASMAPLGSVQSITTPLSPRGGAASPRGTLSAS